MTEYMKEILPKGHKRAVELEPAGRAQKDHIRIKRNLADMPLPAKQLNVVSAICAYTLMGLNDRDIATALNVSIDRVGNIKMLDAYTEVYQHVVKAIIDEEASDVRQLFAANAQKAALELINLTQNATNEAVQIKAIDSVLDRAGHRPADVVEVRGKLENTMQIVYVEADQDEGTIIDAEAIQTD